MWVVNVILLPSLNFTVKTLYANDGNHLYHLRHNYCLTVGVEFVRNSSQAESNKTVGVTILNGNTALNSLKEFTTFTY